jgi:histidine ammonia-lyase
MTKTYELGSAPLDLKTLFNLLEHRPHITLHPDAATRIENCRTFLDDALEKQEGPIYGINTGFGALCNVSIGADDLEALQLNLVCSHACGTGAEVPEDIVRLMLVLKAQALAQGYSGVQMATVQRLLDLWNADCLPIVFEQGSLGASGDLAPLAHLSLTLLGLGQVKLKGKRMDTAAALKKCGLEPIRLGSKEGLALLNGTQFMSAYGAYLLMHSYKLSWLADLVGALSLEGYLGLRSPFDARIADIRPHQGQQVVAARMREFLAESPLGEWPREHVQDPYSFRCIPQVHGASLDTVQYVYKVMQTEFNSVTDNPTIFSETGGIISAGNFHGQPLALALDFLAIALAELGSISERRTYQLISGNRGLPPFLVAKPGLHSGMMIPQYTAAGIVSQNKQYCTPASVDSIESSNGQEDHVSMGANAATKCYKVMENCYQILAIEMLNASQALGFRQAPPNAFLQDFLMAFRAQVPFVDQDRILHNDLIAARDFLLQLDLDSKIYLPS